MIPLLVTLIGSEVLKRIIKAKEYMIFTLQDIAESALFAGWVTYDSGVVDELEWVIDLLDKIARAYSYVVGIPLIVARFGEEINETPHLYEFYSQFPSAREHLQLVEMGISTYINRIDKELLDNLEKLYPTWKMDEEIKEKAEADPFKIFEWFKTMIEALLNQLGGDPLKFIDYCCQQLSQTVYPEYLYYMPDWLVWLLNPFIDIDWVVIKTTITLKWALNHYRLGQLADQLPRPYIPQMRVKLQDEDEILAEGKIGHDGEILFETTTDDPYLTDLFINVHGLILRIPIVEIANKFKVHVLTTNTWIEGLETQWVRVKLYTLPDMTKVYIIRFEDMKNQPDCDFDYDDIQIYIFEKENTFKAYVYGTFGVYENNLYVEGKEKPIYCPPRYAGWTKDEIPPDKYLCAELVFDKETLRLISIKRYTK